jgi:hypothetical protein
VREQVQAQVGVSGIGRGLVEVDLDEDHLLFGAAVLVRAGFGDAGQCLVRVLHCAQVVGSDAQRRCREPDIQDGGVNAGGGDGGHAKAVGGTFFSGGSPGFGHSGGSSLSHCPSLSTGRHQLRTRLAGVGGYSGM